LHKIFGYRGVLLFPWTARVFDHLQNVVPDSLTRTNDREKPTIKANEVKARKQTYYQVLIDNRDSPFIVSSLKFGHFRDIETSLSNSFFLCCEQKAHFESVTFLLNQENNRSLYSIPGLDYVSHDDILPYTVTEKLPISHELFDKFLSANSNSGKASRQPFLILCQSIFCQTFKQLALYHVTHSRPGKSAITYGSN
jgi:polymerase delta-interacting protein 2